MVVQPEGGKGEISRKLVPCQVPGNHLPLPPTVWARSGAGNIKRECVMTKRNRGGNGCRLPLPL